MGFANYKMYMFRTVPQLLTSMPRSFGCLSVNHITFSYSSNVNMEQYFLQFDIIEVNTCTSMPEGGSIGPTVL